MKKQIKLSTLLLSLLMLVLVGCGDSGTDAKVQQEDIKTLVGTKWVLKAFGDVATKEEREPRDLSNVVNKSENLFFIYFSSETQATGYASANKCAGSYSFLADEKRITFTNYKNLTEVNESKDGGEFIDIMYTKINNSKCEFLNGTMKIYYDNETKYLLFNKLTPKIEKN